MLNRKGFFITGTDTKVGKTFVSSGLALAFKDRLDQEISLWKPVQSGAELGSEQSDSYRLKAGSGSPQREEEIVTYSFKEPLAPWIAARNEGKTIDFDALVNEGLKRLERDEVLIVEGAGGLAVPLTEEATIATLAQQLKLPVIIVARPGLGTVNHSVLTASYAYHLGLKVIGIIFNCCDLSQQSMLQDNAMMIENISGFPVIGNIPVVEMRPRTDEEWMDWRSTCKAVMNEYVDIDYILNWRN